MVINKPEEISKWPQGRWLHSGAIIALRSDTSMLVISGGKDENGFTLNDSWIFKITKHGIDERWSKVIAMNQ